MILPVNLDIVHPHSTNTLFKSYIATAYISVMCVFAVCRFVVTIGTMATWLGPHIFYLVPKLSKSWDLARDDILSILLPDIDT